MNEIENIMAFGFGREFNETLRAAGVDMEGITKRVMRILYGDAETAAEAQENKE